jgi:hypothetical protein
LRIDYPLSFNRTAAIVMRPRWACQRICLLAGRQLLREKRLSIGMVVVPAEPDLAQEGLARAHRTGMAVVMDRCMMKEHRRIMDRGR